MLLDDLIDTLFRELIQSERSLQRHAERDARHLGEVQPAAPLRAVAADAGTSLIELSDLAKRLDLPDRPAGFLIGTALSLVRDLIDPLLETERSYRATLLGVRHGIDLVVLLRSMAMRSDKYGELVNWCEGWLHRREVLCNDIARDMAWFGHHPVDAAEPVREGMIVRQLQRLAAGWGRAERKRRTRHAEQAAAAPSDVGKARHKSRKQAKNMGQVVGGQRKGQAATAQA